MDMSSTGSFYSKLHSTRVQAHGFEASNVSSHALSERSRSRGFQRLALDRLASLFCQKQPNRTWACDNVIGPARSHFSNRVAVPAA